MFRGRLVGIGVGDYASEVHRRLDHAVDDVVALTGVLGADFDGEPLRNPTETEVRDFLKSLKNSLSPDGPLVVVWSGHGLPAEDGLRLLARDSGADAAEGLGVRDVVAPCALSGANQLLFVFDTCFSGDAIPASDLATQIMRETRNARQVWVGVVTSCLSLETARDGLFGQRLRKVLEQGPDMPELRVRWSPHNRYVRGDDVCDAVLKEWSSGAQSPDFQSRGSAWWMFPNPLYRPGAPEQVVEHLLRAARSGAPLEAPSWFTGRTAEVNTVVGWVRRRQPGLYVVTGSAGTGKSAILGRVVSLSNPEERERLLADGHPWSHELPEERSVSAHVHARGLTADLAADHLAGQLVQRGVLTAQDARRNASELVGEVQRAVEDGARAPVLVVDGLDEARGEAFKVADDLLTRLAAHAVVVVSTRDMQRGDGHPGLVATLAPDGAGIDLDDPAVQQRGRADLTEYVRLRLRDVDARMDAGAVADHLFGTDAAEAQHTFLLARLVTDQLSAVPVDTSVEGWEDTISHSVEDALDTDLAAVVPAPERRSAQGPVPTALARVILRALTWGYGAGFPEEEWLCVANVEAPDGVEVTREDITWVLDQLGRHIVQDGEAGIAVYRMAHQSLADHLRPAFRGSPEQPFNPAAQGVAEALLDRYRSLLAGGIAAEKPSYLWFYLWRHAAETGQAGIALLRSLAQQTPSLLPDVGMAAGLVANRFQHWGRSAEALAVTEEAVRLWRVLAEMNPAHLPSLAMALNNLGVCYGNVGRPTEAPALAEEAVRLWRSLAEENPGHLPDLATALNNLGSCYSDVGRWAEALPPAEEAVDLWRALTEENTTYLPDLADALNSLGNRYSDVGRRAEALTPTEEAVELWRALAEENPIYLPNLAMSLNNVGVRYSEVGRRTEALAPTEEAVRLRRVLAEENPAYLPNLAAALNNLGNRYSDVGRLTEAIAPTEEAVRLRRTLAEENPAHLPNLATALKNLGISYSDAGRWDEALAPTEEAVSLSRTLAEENPAYLPDLAGALNSLGIRYSYVGNQAEALPPTEEAVLLWRALAEENRAYLPDLAGSLNNLGIRYSNVGRQAEAVTPTEEAIDLYRALAEENRAYLPNLAGSLNNLGIRYSDVGRLTEAIAPTEEAVRLRRTLAEENPAHLPSLAGSLYNLSLVYGELGRWAEAPAPAEEAVDLWRALAEENPAHLTDLADSLHNLSIVYGETGRRAEAPAPAEEAVDLWHALTRQNPAHLANLAVALNNVSKHYAVVGQSADELWEGVLGEADPGHAAFLLLARSSTAQAGDGDATAWLVEAERAITAATSPGLVGVLHSEGRRHRTAAPETFDEVWHRLTGAHPPAWLTIDPGLLAQAEAWIGTASYEAERDHLAAHPELLSPEADSAVDEVLLDLQEEAAQRYRELRRLARSVGVDHAYQPLLSSVLAYEFATASPEDRRTLLRQRRDDLLDDLVLEALSGGATDPDPETARLCTQAECLLMLAELDADADALDALDDPSGFPALLATAARRPDPAPLAATACLALTAATSDSLTATAEFHLAVAAAIDDDPDAAGTLLDHACDHHPAAVPAWITALAEIAQHHPAALTLIPRLTTRLEEPDDPTPTAALHD
ncbi:tetratricopeptide repeat protein [Streptomyces sp. S.PNR 29]|uniref:tetratricopeptide repeat protein n=1 Tax=Streptomyces sp. S.PNR 29 TaxID=2973805 RepID=UPI0025B218B8|nr:tetratricopeptide repeat protein [Streptomyces sp. S.PNR 29]MDN0194421.1 tetratricopeptide repeat protein [Streptomyces sp. S.PNR 29]